MNRRAQSGSRDAETLESLLTTFSAHGERPALIQVHGDESMRTTYASLAADVARHANRLRAAGIEPGANVVLFASGGLDWIRAFLGLVGAGAVPVPLDVQVDERALRHILADCAAEEAIVDGERGRALDAVGYAGRRFGLDGAADAESGTPVHAIEPPRRGGEDTAVLFYTSGTTGPPKGVPLSHRNIVFQLESVARAGLVCRDDRILQPLPPHHVYPLVVGTLAPLSLGLPVILPAAMLGPQIIAAIRQERVTFLVGVPRLYQALVAGIESRIADRRGPAAWYLRFALGASRTLRRRLGLRLGKILLRPLHRRLAPDLRVLASGGAPLDPALAEKLEGFGWRVAVGYGLTETSPLLTLNPPGNRRLDSVGRAIPGIELSIDTTVLEATEDAAGLAPATGDGEILARGPGVFGGYLAHERDADTFTSDGWFRTGDLGRLDADGHLLVTGRRNTLIVTGAGKNIQPDELEDSYAQHAFIEEIGILLHADRLVAVVVPATAEIRRRGRSIDEAIRAAIGERGRELASYKRIGKHVLSREPLPRTRLGKIQRHRLRELYDKCSAAPDRGARTAAPRAPEEMSRDDRELLANEKARRVWELLAARYPRHGLSLDTSFELDLGIDSLGWLDLSAEIAAEARIQLDEQRIAELETVRDLLRLAVESERSGAGVVTPIESPDAFLSETQKRSLAPLPRAARTLTRVAWSLNRLLVTAAFRLHVSGAESLPPDRQLLIAPNHTSFLDAFAVAGALPRNVLEHAYWGGWTGYLFGNSLVRAISRLMHIVPVDPERAAQSSIAFAAAVIESKHHLVWFPEGERSTSGELLEFKPGLGMLLERFPHLIVVPTLIEGAYEAWPRDRAWPRFRPIDVTFGAPLDHDKLSARGTAREPRKRIVEGLRATMLALQGHPASR